MGAVLAGVTAAVVFPLVWLTAGRTPVVLMPPLALSVAALAWAGAITERRPEERQVRFTCTRTTLELQAHEGFFMVLRGTWHLPLQGLTLAWSRYPWSPEGRDARGRLRLTAGPHTLTLHHVQASDDDLTALRAALTKASTQAQSRRGAGRHEVPAPLQDLLESSPVREPPAARQGSGGPIEG